MHEFDDPADANLVGLAGADELATEDDNSTIRRVTSRGLAVAVATLALVGGGDTSRSNAAPMPATVAKYPKQINAPVLMPEIQSKCTPNTRILFTLEGAKVVKPDQPAEYLLTAKSCPGTSNKSLKKVKVTVGGDQQKIRKWEIKNLAPGGPRRRVFKMTFPEFSADTNSINDTAAPVVTVRASKNGKRIGSNEWVLDKQAIPGSELDYPRPLAEDEPCKPRKNFVTGVQDDDAFVWQKYGGRDAALKLAKETFPGITALRINVLYNDVKAHGYEQYIDTINAAKESGFNRFYITLIPTPSYRPDGDQTLNYINLDPAEMRRFAQEAAAALGPDVSAFEIMNEANHPFFNQQKSLELYKPLAAAGLAGVRSSNPNAKVVLGGLAPDDPASLEQWLSGLKGVGDELSMHPYGALINNLRRYVAAAGGKAGRLELSEYGYHTGDPDQMVYLKRATALARCAGAASLFYYLLYDQPENTMNWHTGVLPAPYQTPSGQ